MSTIRITELFELEGILESHLVHLPCNEQGQLDQAAQSPVSLTFSISGTGQLPL